MIAEIGITEEQVKELKIQIDLARGNCHATIDAQFDRLIASFPKAPPAPDTKNPLEGFALLPVIPGWTEAFKAFNARQAAAKIAYAYGGKDKTPYDPNSFDYVDQQGKPVNGIDCSGDWRVDLITITGGKLKIPDGSQAQGNWLRDYRDEKGQMLKRSTKQNLGEMDGRLRAVVYREKEGRNKIGHIFNVLNGVTYESYGGHGVGSRPWNHPTIQAIADEVYVIADAEKQA